MFTLLGDLRYGVRMLLSAPRVTIAALLSLALGIGANTAMFTVINAVMLKPLPYTESDRLVMVWETASDSDRRPVAPANFIDWRREARSFGSLAAWDEVSVNLTGISRAGSGAAGSGLSRLTSRPERLRAVSASGNLFDLLGVHATIGRTLSMADEAADAPRVAVLTHGLWQRLFAASPAALGQTLVLDGQPAVIVGVLPPDFALTAEIDVYLSGDRGVPRAHPFPGDITQVRDSHIITVTGRLKDGVSVEQAQAEMSTIMRRLEQAYPGTNTTLGARVVPLHDDMVAETRPALLLLLGAVAFLLLIACVNVANLLLGRAIARQREIAVRMSLGATRARLVQQFLAETAVLALAGGAAGLILARWGVDALMALAPADLPRLSEVRPDLTTTVFAFVVALGTAFIFGLVPALQASRQDAAGAIKDDGTRTAGSRSHRRLHQALAVSELALAQVLLAGAGLLIASFIKVQNVELGFRTDQIIAVEVFLGGDRYQDPARKAAFHQRVLERLDAIPGVESAAMALTVPFRGAINRGVWITGQPTPPPGFNQSIDFQIISPEYFQTLGVPMLDGRAFSERDDGDAPLVAVVSRAMASKYWPGENAIGKQVQVGGPNSKPREIVGIVGDVRQRDPERAPEPLMYIPYLQDTEPWNWAMFALRTNLDPASLTPAVRAAVFEIDPEQPVARIRTMNEIAGTLGAERRFNTLLLALFSGVALILAAIGTYGVMAYSVTRRTREIGVRMALGARPGDVLRMVLGQGAGLVAIAIVLGLAGAIAASRVIASQLFDTTAHDPVTLAAGAATLCAFALLACYVPARRAMKVEPLEALRRE
jgi:putative ABC transport system permease protein